MPANVPRHKHRLCSEGKRLRQGVPMMNLLYTRRMRVLLAAHRAIGASNFVLCMQIAAEGFCNRTTWFAGSSHTSLTYCQHRVSSKCRLS